MVRSLAPACRVALVVVVVALSACSVVDPFIGTNGGCQLVVKKDQDQTSEVIEPPYEVELLPPGPDNPTFISFNGSGWQDVRVIVTDPGGFLDDDWRGVGDWINSGGVAFTIDEPGTWHFHLSDRIARCERDFTVEVLPPA